MGSPVPFGVLSSPGRVSARILERLALAIGVLAAALLSLAVDGVGVRVGVGRLFRTQQVDLPGESDCSSLSVGPPVALALDETTLAAEPSAASVTSSARRVDGAARVVAVV